MNADDYFSSIGSSSTGAWLKSESAYLSSLEQVSGTAFPVSWLDLERPHTLASFRPNLAISVAIGRSLGQESVSFDWARFPDAAVHLHAYDFLYNGSLIYTAIYASVDGARSELPLPKAGTLNVPRLQHDVFRALANLAGTSHDFDDYFGRAGFQIVDDQWPV